MLEIDFDIKDQIGVRATWPNGDVSVAPCGTREKAEAYAEKLLGPDRQNIPDKVEIVEREKMTIFGEWEPVE